MSARHAKQLIYGTLYLVFVVLICWGFYGVFIAPAIVASTPPVCTPSSCAPTSTAPITVGKLSTFITSPGHYTFLAQVTDQSVDYGASVLNYAITLEDASGTVLQSIPAESFIYPSQTKYLAVLNQVISQPFDYATLVVTNAAWIASSTIGAIPAVAPGQFAIQNVDTSVASTTVSVGGQLVNTGVASFEQVLVTVIFKSSVGNPIGVSQTQLSNVAAGTTQNFSVIYPAEPGLDPTLNQLIVYALR
jgi:hypothetical protein